MISGLPGYRLCGCSFALSFISNESTTTDSPTRIAPRNMEPMMTGNMRKNFNALRILGTVGRNLLKLTHGKSFVISYGPFEQTIATALF